MTGELVYNFSYSANQAIQARDSSQSAESTDGNGNYNGGSNGISHYSGSLSDKGIITVRITGKQPDGGLIVSISEQGENVRKAPAGNLRRVRQHQHYLRSEQDGVYRGVHAVALPRLELRRPQSTRRQQALAHRSFEPRKAQTVQADYAITSNNNGVMQIGETRKIVYERFGQA